MCNFISWKIEKSPEGLKHVFAPSLDSHGDVPGNGYEAEWTTEGLEIRVPDNESDHKVDALGNLVRAEFNRDQFILYAAKEIIATGKIPAVWEWETSNWNDRTKRLFACDCAEHVAHLYTLPTEWQPSQTIEVARKYANGLATQDELDAARDAAWAAAGAAAGAAARDAARSAARDAAWAAARSAARDAAGAAAWDAARAAARAAARSAAGDAVGSAAWDAARAAAGAAARDAEEKWQTSRLLEYLEGKA